MNICTRKEINYFILRVLIFGLYETQMETKVIYLVAPSNGFKLLALPHDPHHHGLRRSR